jgi:hypothetical protein
LVSCKRARLEHGAKRPSRLKIDMTRETRRRTPNRQRSRRPILPSPQAANATSLRHIGAPRPMRLRMTMTGSRFPGSRVTASDHLPRMNSSQWYLWSSAIRLQLRGQPRN